MKSELTKEKVTYPLMADCESIMRLYLLDCGLFASQSRIDMTTFYDSEKRNELSGIFFENYVAEELNCKGIPLYFWKGKNDSEFEFLVMSKNRIIPIDVKKGKGVLNSLDKFKNHNSCDLAVKISRNNYGYDTSKGILTLPLYMVFLLCRDICNNNV